MLSSQEANATLSAAFQVRLDSVGRILLPKSVRDDLHIAAGDTLTVAVKEGCLIMKTREQALAEARAYFADLAPPEVILSDELVADRRAEAAND